MNNKGQVLPIFVILLPIIILIISYIVDIGLMYSEKRRIVNITSDAINYYFDSKNQDNTLEILNKNIKNGEFNINVDSEFITINVKKEHKSSFNIINLNNTINITYKGNLNTRRIIKG